MDHLAQIKADEQRVKEEISKGTDRIPITRNYTTQQLGLHPVYADDGGNLWMVGASELIRVSVR